jgi:hypothetical protein
MTEIRRFKEQPGTHPDAESRRIVEDLTGWRFENLWGRPSTITAAPRKMEQDLKA